MSNRTQKSIAQSLEVREHLLPHMPYLLQDLWALGSATNEIIKLVGSLNLSYGSKVLDLGCGKGAVSILLAEKYNVHLTSIDAMVPFLEDAKSKAKEIGVEHLCDFRKQDVLNFTSIDHEFDLVVLASLGGIFGTIEDTVAVLRRQIKVQGYMIIDDGYLKEKESLKRQGYGHYRNHDKTIEELVNCGDRLIAEVSTTDESMRINTEYLQLIDRRGRELIANYPELEPDILSYLELQKEECEVIDDQIEGALWLLQKTSP